ncbi:hypothetical protein F3Y22_tig00110481pilonHSYRG00081 [Hibiscus syriacus]|uniref:Uncharacterized protein n=1 Tax=Hibiscus syriacus TaxID=106335 RepID=A0A6A3AE33_HIBSY|nr:hypothetical protein F3Y22_tig00110481pilonHSYRG00081 [Hibiscus syriacus]
MERASKGTIICIYYSKGNCFYGSRCRYEHVKASQSCPSASSSSTAPDFVPSLPSKTTFIGLVVSSAAASTKIPDSGRAFVAPSKLEGNSESVPRDLSCNGETVEPRSGNPVQRPICSLLQLVIAPVEKNVLTFMETGALPVKNIPTAAVRKFGILSECDHPFCITCIRNWRNSSPSSGMDVNTTLRACPICRKLSYFVIPSVIWYWSPEEKQRIVDGYNAKLRQCHCSLDASYISSHAL